jgi:hypothetical protein
MLISNSLAYAEIYMSLAHIIRRFDFVLHETTMNNITVYRELGIGYPKEGCFNVKAKVESIIEK